MGDETTIDDLLDSRPGGTCLKSKDDLAPIVQPDPFGARGAGRGVGWSSDREAHRLPRPSAGLSLKPSTTWATGVMEITERADMRVELIARHAAAALSSCAGRRCCG